MIYYFISLMIIFINFLINKSICKKMFYPPTLYSLIWFVMIFLHFIVASFDYLGVKYISVYSLIIFTIGPCIFTLGGIFIKLPQKKDDHNPEFFYINKKFLNVLMMLSTILLPLYAYESYLIVMNNSITGNYMQDLRLNLNSGEFSRKYVYGIIFAFFYFFICLYGVLIKHESIGKKRLIYSTVILVLYIVLSTGRTAFLQFFILILGLISSVKYLKIKYIIGSTVAFVLLFFIYGFIMEKGTDKNASFSDNLVTMNENMTTYLIGGISAFDHKMNNGFKNFNGERTFRLPIAILNKLGVIDSKPQELVEDFVFVPFPTNVYTSYQVYIEDFGVFYILIVLLSQSILHTFFFKNSLANNKYRFQNLYLYSLFLFPLIMSFFQDQFISLLPTWLYAFLLISISKKFIYFKK